MNSYAAVLELLGYEIINEVEDRILVRDTDYVEWLYINNKLEEVHYIVDRYKGAHELIMAVKQNNKYFTIGHDLKLKDEIVMTERYFV